MSLDLLTMSVKIYYSLKTSLSYLDHWLLLHSSLNKSSHYPRSSCSEFTTRFPNTPYWSSSV